MSMSMATPNFQRSQEAIIYVGNIDSKVNEALLCQLFTQVGQVLNVHIPRDKITNEHSNYGFVEFKSETDADYSIRIMHLVKLFGKPIKVNKTGGQDKRTLQVGANLFVGNLDPQVDQKLLYQTFSNFGPVLNTKIMRADDTGKSKGFGFVAYDRFESSDQAIAAMNGQFFAGKQVSVQYAIKKDSKKEKHGSAAERLLAANKPIGQNKSLFVASRQPISINLPQQLLNSQQSLSILKTPNSAPLIITSTDSQTKPAPPKLPALPLPTLPLPNLPSK